MIFKYFFLIKNLNTLPNNHWYPFNHNLTPSFKLQNIVFVIKAIFFLLHLKVQKCMFLLLPEMIGKNKEKRF